MLDCPRSTIDDHEPACVATGQRMLCDRAWRQVEFVIGRSRATCRRVCMDHHHDLEICEPCALAFIWSPLASGTKGRGSCLGSNPDAERSSMGIQPVTKPSAPAEVNNFMKALRHPLGEVAESLRQIILKVDADI